MKKRDRPPVPKSKPYAAFILRNGLPVNVQAIRTNQHGMTLVRVSSQWKKLNSKWVFRSAAEAVNHTPEVKKVWYLKGNTVKCARVYQDQWFAYHWAKKGIHAADAFLNSRFYHAAFSSERAAWKAILRRTGKKVRETAAAHKAAALAHSLTMARAAKVLGSD